VRLAVRLRLPNIASMRAGRPAYPEGWAVTEDVPETRIGSSFLAWVAYQRIGRVMDLGFLNGAIYRYYLVSPQRVLAFMFQAPSKGRYFNRNIKGHYAFDRVQKGRHRSSARRSGSAARSRR
jgi:KTSC domain-containing protein